MATINTPVPRKDMKLHIILSFWLLANFAAFGKSSDDTAFISRGIIGNDDCSILKKSKAYCIVQNKNNAGFSIILSTDNEKNRLVGYTENGSWDERKMPPVLIRWLNYLDSIYVASDAIKMETIVESEHNTNQRMDILPLLSCHWHQDSPYNDLSPIITDGNVKTAAGCVAIAAAQIAYYWRRDNPDSTMEDTPIYPYGAAPVTVSIPQGSPNNWELMKDSYTDEDSPASRYAAAQLCYVIGTTSYLNYASSTGGHISDASNALYSQYNILSDYARKTNYSQNEWEDLIYLELSNGRPILCAGTDNGGHAFVLDGYDAQKGLYHFNFGWGGSGDGYYPIDDSEIAMGGYYMDQAIVYNIRPAHRNIEASLIIKHAKGKETCDVTINITNHSTLDIKCLKLYLVTDGETLDDMEDPIWQNEVRIECNGVNRQITAYDVASWPKENCSLYLTDENNDSLCHISMFSESSMKELWLSPTIQPTLLYNINGYIIKHPTDGIFINGNDEKQKTIIIK